MANPIVSIIVPCYNAEKFLPTVFKCFDRQTYKDFQIIFVDDGSTDGTLNALNGYCATRPQHTVITGENAGAASARNKGLNAVKGDLFVFCDADDILADNHLELLVKHLSENNADMAVCAIQRLSGAKADKYNFARKPRAEKLKIYDAQSALTQYFSQELFDFPLFNKIYRTDILKASGARFFDGARYGEESYFVCRYLMFSEKIVYYGAKTYVYLQHKNSLMHSGFNENRLDIFTNIQAVMDYVKQDGRFISVLPYIFVMRAGYSIGMLYFILRGKYKNDCVVASIANCLKTDATHIKKCKKIAFYKKAFIPVCVLLAKIRFRKQIKKYPELSGVAVSELAAKSEN